MKVSLDKTYRTSSQIALADPVFRELFCNNSLGPGFIVVTNYEYSLAVLYKDVMLQALSDYVNHFHSNYTPKEMRAVKSVHKWIWRKSIFLEPDKLSQFIKKAETRLNKFRSNKSVYKHMKKEIDEFKQRALLGDPFNFETTCQVLGLEIHNTRKQFDQYYKLKQTYGNSIRIVRYTGKKSELTIPSINDIIYLNNSDTVDNIEYLRMGVNRKDRDSAIVRKRKENKGLIHEKDES